MAKKSGWDPGRDLANFASDAGYNLGGFLGTITGDKPASWSNKEYGNSFYDGQGIRHKGVDPSKTPAKPSTSIASTPKKVDPKIAARKQAIIKASDPGFGHVSQPRKKG